MEIDLYRLLGISAALVVALAAPFLLIVGLLQTYVW